MSNPSELDGEVDHSFFDSDCDNSSISKDAENTSDKVYTDSSESEEDIHLCSKRPNGTLTSLSAEGKEGDYRVRDSESSCSSVQERSSSEPPTLPRPKKSSLSPGGRRTQVGLGGTQGGPVDQTEESEDTVTDVSPLSSPDFSPRQSLESNPSEAEEGTLTEQHQQEEESVPPSGLSSAQQNEDSDQDSDNCFLSSESQFGGGLVFPQSRGRHRKNYSFTNDQVRCIDRENQRLLRELSRLSPGPRPGSTAGKKTHMANNSQLIRLSHSALNRQREQQRIERENLAFLKRLESVEATPGLKRSQQLADYQRQMSYPGGPSYPVCLSTTKKERSSSKTPSAGPRPVSSVHPSPRSVSTSPNPRNTPTARSKKTNAARPAWC